MNRPSLPSRLASSPVGSLLIWSACALVVLAWWQGIAPWWQALIAAAIAKSTFNARRELRRYKAWEAEWDAMGAPLEGEAAPAPKTSHRASLAVLSVVVILVVVYAPESIYRPYRNEFAIAAFLAFSTLLFLAGRSVVRFAFRKFGRVASAETGKAVNEAAPVAWFMDGASSSPSRMEAASNLPDYSGRLMDR